MLTLAGALAKVGQETCGAKAMPRKMVLVAAVARVVAVAPEPELISVILIKRFAEPSAVVA